MDKTQSNTIAYIRFPLIIGVVFAHSYFLDDKAVCDNVNLVNDGSFCFYIQYLFSNILGRQSTPLFALISGFLFFFNNNDFSYTVYFAKLRRRAKSLLLPYVIWNGMFVIGYLFVRNIPYFEKWYFSSNHELSTLSFGKIVSFFWDGMGGYPIDYQFWFVRDLMIVIVFSPLIRILLDKFKFWGVLFLGILWFFQQDLILLNFNIRAFFFFTLGAYFAINKLNLISEFRKFFAWSCVVYVLNIFLELLLIDSPINLFVHNFGLIVGGVFFMNLVSYQLQKNVIHVCKFLTSATFFVFAAHEPLLTLIKKALFKLLVPKMEWELISIYFIIPLLTISICLSVYYLLLKFTPKFASLLTGR